jgi:2-keto-4-pentenoate hydratase/2-oxohepta-3-ene-1,7-dioic acid hydratase in catechol pathway
VSAGVEGKSHVAAEWYEAPTFYFTNPHTILGPDDVLRPPVTDRLDFELEVAVIIGGTRDVGESNLTVEDAASVVFGYTIMNDWSARDLQGREMKVRLGPAKGKDFGTALGPWIVTADELEPHRRDDRLHLELAVDLNGERIGDDTLANMAWSFEAMVAYASRGTWVQTGDVLGSGTCGTGCLLELWGRQRQPPLPPLSPGDEVTLHVEGIGSVTNRIVDGAEPVAIPAARPVERRLRPWSA